MPAETLSPIHTPIFAINDKVVVNHQPDLGPCAVVDPCDPTEMQYLKGDVLTPVGFYVRIKSRKVKGILGYHEASLTLVPQAQYAPE